MRVFFDRELDSVATFWRVFRTDGVALGFTSHDRDLSFGGIRHRSAPGMVPAAIRMTTEISDDEAEVEGALSHDSISESDLAAGLFDEAGITIGVVDWNSLEWRVLYSGQLGRIEENNSSFSAQLRSAKHILDHDLVPRTSPTCRAEFCGLGCGLSAQRFTSRQTVMNVDFEGNRLELSGSVSSDVIDGRIRMLSGPQVGVSFGILDTVSGWITLDRPMASGVVPGIACELQQGCDHTLATCSARFANAVNFRGEPFLPGNDLLARYGQSGG